MKAGKNKEDKGKEKIIEIVQLSKKQRKTLINALKYFGSIDLIDKVKFIRVLHAMDNPRHANLTQLNSVYVVSPELDEFIQNTIQNASPALKEKVMCVGIKVGEVGKRFRFTLEGAYLIAKSDKKKVYINDKAEMLFLYGRDVFSSSILGACNFRENDIVFVCNKRGDILGIGKARFNSNIIKNIENRVAVENLVDRGEYLRKDKLYSAF